MRKHVSVACLLLVLTSCSWGQQTPVDSGSGSVVEQKTVIPEKLASLDVTKPSTTPEEDTLRLQKAVLEQKSDVCDSIGDAKKKSSCMVAVINAEATKNVDTQLCNKLENDIQKQLCVRGVIYQKSVKEKNPSACGELKDAQLQRDCEDNYYLLAVSQTKDASLCDKLSQSSAKTECADRILVEQLTPETVSELSCSKVTSDQLKKDCAVKAQGLLTIATAKKEKKLEICAQISSPSYKDLCRSEVKIIEAVEKKDVKLCESLSESLFVEGESAPRNMKQVCSDAVKK